MYKHKVRSSFLDSETDFQTSEDILIEYVKREEVLREDTRKLSIAFQMHEKADFIFDEVAVHDFVPVSKEIEHSSSLLSDTKSIVQRYQNIVYEDVKVLKHLSEIYKKKLKEEKKKGIRR